MFSLPLLARQIQRPDTRHKASVLCRVPVSNHQVCMCSFSRRKKQKPMTHLSSWVRFTFLPNIPEEEILLGCWKTEWYWQKWMKLKEEILLGCWKTEWYWQKWMKLKEEILLGCWKTEWYRQRWMKLTGCQKQSTDQQGHKNIRHTLKAQWSFAVKNVLYCTLDF